MKSPFWKNNAVLSVLRNRKDLYWILGISIVVFAYYTIVSYTQYASHRFFLADIGVNDLVIANTIRGDFMQSPIMGWNYLAVHFKLILLVFTPLYVLFDHVLTLATGYNLALAAGCIPLYALAKRELSNAALAMVFAVAYLLNHFVLSLQLSLHPESLAFPAMFLLFLTGSKGRSLPYWGALVWTLSVKEDFALYLLFYGVYLAVAAQPRNPRRGWITVVVCLVWMVISFLIMGILKPDGESYKGGVPLIERYASMGDSWGAVLLYLVTHPHVPVLRIVTNPAFLLLLGTVGFLPLLHPRSLWLLIPPAAIYLVSDFGPQRELLYYYAYPFLPFVFLSAIQGARWLIEKQSRFRIVLGIGLLLPIWGALVFPTRVDGYRHRPFPITEHHRLARLVIEEYLPPDATVAAQYDLICQVPHRSGLVPLWPENLDAVDYVFLDTLGKSPDLTTETREAVQKRINSPEWEVLTHQDGYVVLRKRGPSEEEKIGEPGEIRSGMERKPAPSDPR